MIRYMTSYKPSIITLDFSTVTTWRQRLRVVVLIPWWLAVFVVRGKVNIK